MKNLLFAAALLSVALWTGCATGGSGHSKGIQVTVASAGNAVVVGVTLTLQFTATVTGTDNHAVTWSVSGAGCTGSACGTIDATSGLYTAPATAPNPGDVNIVATSQADTSKSGSLTVTVVQITVTVTPNPGKPLNVVKGVQQQFTATNLPDDPRAQSVTWSLICGSGGNDCGTLNASTGLYTAPSVIPATATAQVTATSTIDPTGFDTVDIAIVKSRLVANSNYAFHFSGFDSNGAIAVAGTLATDANGAIATGTEDEQTVGSGYSLCTVLATSSFVSDPLDNGHATMTLRTNSGGCSVNARTFKVVIKADGDARMIEFDANVNASGEIAQATKSKFKNSVLTNCQDANNVPIPCSFAFGFSGADLLAGRTGVVGVFKSSTAGIISSGMLDMNKGGTASSSIDITGTYNIDTTSGRGTMNLTVSGVPRNYAIYMVGGITNKALNPLTLFAISTDDPLSGPAVSGTIVFQDPTPAYTNADFTDFWVSSLTGVNNTGHALVSLTNANGDGNGHTNGLYDANNAGTIVAAKSFNNYSYSSDNLGSTLKGRYTLDLLGDPAANPVVPPTHFVLYSSAASRGFLLEIDNQSHIPAEVYFGQMDQQPGSSFAPAELAGSFAAATINSGTAAVSQQALNFLFTFLAPDATVGGMQDVNGDPNREPLAGTYGIDQFTGIGKITLTQPPPPAPENYVIYALDNPKQAKGMIQTFIMINVDSANTDPSVIFTER